MLNRILGFLFLSVSFWGCEISEKKIVDSSPIVVNLLNRSEQAKRSNNFKDMFDIETVTQLESNDSSLIATIGKILLVNDTIFILDTKYTGIKVFNLDGEYLYTIGRIGQGPGEFSRIFDMAYDSSERNIIVYSNDDMKMAIFSLQGKLLSERRVPFYAYYFTSLGNGDFMFYTNFNNSEYSKEHNLLLTDSFFKVKERFFPYKRNFAVSMSGFLKSTTEGLLYAEPFDDKIYQFVDNNFVLKYKFNLGKYLINPELTNDFGLLTKHLLDYSYISSVSAENERYLFFSYVHKRLIDNGFYDKKTRITYSRGHFREGDIFQVISSVSSVSGDNQKFVSVIDAETLRYTKARQPNFTEEMNKNYPAIANKINSLKDLENPIIIVFKQKKHE